MPIHILQALNTETCLNCLWWQAWWFVTKQLRATWTLSWNIQTKTIGNFEKDIYFNHLATIYTGLIWFQATTKETCARQKTHPSFLKLQMWLVFMAVHSRYDRHYLKDILCSSDLWKARGSKEFTLPHLLRHTCELVHINSGGVVFSYSSKNLTAAKSGERVARNLWWPELCEEWNCYPVKCGTWSHGLQSMLDESLQHRPVREPWMTEWYSTTEMDICWPTSLLICLLNSVSNEAFSESQSDAFPAIVESNSEAWDSSVKGIMDHCCLVQGTWHGHHAAQLQQSTSQGNSGCMLHSFGQTKFMPPNPDQTWKVSTYKCSSACTIQFSGRYPAQ